MTVHIERLSTGVLGIDRMLAGGIPRGFFVAVVGEPGTGKTVFAIHYAWQGIKDNDKDKAVDEGKAIIIDALLKSQNDEWSLEEVDVETLVNKVIEAKRKLGYGRSRLIIDSMSTFWLDKPAMARKYSYAVKRVLYRWDFTVLMTSQYAITTSSAFGWGLEHVADGIIRFGRKVVGGELKRYILVEKMRQTPHDLRVNYIDIKDGEGLVILGPANFSKEDLALPEDVKRRIRSANKDLGP